MRHQLQGGKKSKTSCGDYPYEVGKTPVCDIARPRIKKKRLAAKTQSTGVVDKGTVEETVAKPKTYITPKSTIKIPTHEQLEKMVDALHNEAKQTVEVPEESTGSVESIIKIEADKIQKAWADLAIKKKENIQEYAVLNRDVIWDEHTATLIIELDNDLQLVSFNKLKPELTTYFKDLLGLKVLNTEVEVVHKEDTSVKLYTNRDRFEHLAKSNPLLQDFVKRLGLELE